MSRTLQSSGQNNGSKSGSAALPEKKLTFGKFTKSLF